MSRSNSHPPLVRARLDGHAPEDIREYWVEIDEVRWPAKQVIALAAGARCGRFQSQDSRRWLGGPGFAIGLVEVLVLWESHGPRLPLTSASTLTLSK